jgi:hypothetical protein
LLTIVVCLSELEIRGPGLTHASLEGGCKLELAVVDTGKHFRTGRLTTEKVEWREIGGEEVLVTRWGQLRFTNEDGLLRIHRVPLAHASPHEAEHRR